MRVFQKNSNIFNLLSEGVSEGIIVVNIDQVIVATNSSADEMFGYGKDDLLGKPLDALIPKRFHTGHDQHVSNFINKSEKRQMGQGHDLFGIRKNSEEFPVEVGLNPFEIYASTYIMALVIDITERKKKEKELIHWAKIFDESLNEIYVFDSITFRFVDVNKEAQRNMGYSLEEFNKLTPIDIKPEFNSTEFKKLVAPFFNGKESKITFETTHVRKNGTSYPVEVHLQRSVLERGAVFVAIILDITERKNYTENLERTVQERTQQLTVALAKEKELNELKTRFLSLVSHEFKTPLSGILTSATLVGKYAKENQQAKRDKHLKTIVDQVSYLNAILTDFLSVERLETGKENYKIADFSLSKVINEVVYSANMQLKNGQRISYPQNTDDVVLCQDEKIVSLCLTNLLYNAVKYSPEDSEIDLKVELSEDKVVFHIKDQGIGIPEKDQEHIFERYFRAENVLTTQGTGIGLNIVKAHVKNLGGKIYFKSKEKKGSIFTIELPVKPDSGK